tara:strand:- start:3395 stop:5200 length:1806 start_codon:yes stop_codon:yes gene_type:complete
MIKIFRNKRLLAFLIILILGFFLFLFDLGSTGLVDETPPLFASAGRAMSQSGDWFTPKVNGILRFDKPPFYYWMMAIFYSLGRNENWDALGSLSARLPSALSSLFLMLIIADTIICTNRDSNRSFYLSIVSSLAFSLSPLIIIWSRTAVSDSLLCSTVGISLLMFWRKIVSDNDELSFMPWFFLGLAILTKGPVALIIVSLTLILFFSIQKNWQILIMKINPIRGILITLFVSLPWYLMQLIDKGKIFWDNFFGYHNVQRYTSVVNNHAEPWWFFIYIMILSSLPFTAFLIHGIIETIKEFFQNLKSKTAKSDDIYIFSACWIFSIFLFFTISATKLPSYWLPAIPAASILITKSAEILLNKSRNFSSIWLVTTFLLFGISCAFYFSDGWLSLINDPEMPNLVSKIKESGLILRSRIFLSVLTVSSLIFVVRFFSKSILFLQILFIFIQFLIMSPVRKIADNLRQLPIREISKEIIQIRQQNEPLVMIGIRKPSLHFYSKQIVFYESSTPVGIINLSERLAFGNRRNELDNPNYDSNTLLVVIDKYSKNKKHWVNIKHQNLGVFGIYNLIRIQKSDLNLYSKIFKKEGFQSTWMLENFEKF